MNSLGALFIAVFLVILFVGRSYYDSIQRSKLMRQIKNTWGHPKQAKCRHQDISLYHDLCSKRILLEKQDKVLDDWTWSDLHLEDIFSQIDHSQSTVGKQILYHILRTPSFRTEELAQRDQLADYFSVNTAIREQLQAILQVLNNQDAAFLPQLFLEELPDRPSLFWVFPLLTLSALCCLLGALIHPLLLLGLAPIALANIVIAPAYRQQIASYILPLRVLGALLDTGRRMQSLAEAEGSDVLEGCLTPYRTARPYLYWLARITPLLVFEQAASNDSLQLIYAYLNMFLLTDVNIFVFSLEAIRRNQHNLLEVYKAVGNIDAMISIASFRQGLSVYVKPTFIPLSKKFQVEEAIHPLLNNPVPNSLCVNNIGLFLTGSNMSGKTTFMRTVGVNIVLAQTLCTCLATRYEAPLLHVQTCISRSDSIAEGKSYYLAEVERIGQFLAIASAGPPHFFIMDEIYRGTNTIERVAAAKAVLDALNREEDYHFVLVSTHDLEIARLLKTNWMFFHFREFVRNADIVFDYKLQTGLSSTRNALRLLEEAGYPTSVVRDAESTALFLERRTWTEPFG